MPNPLSFSAMLQALIDSGKNSGVRATREGWNGKGLFIQAQFPDEHSKMGNPYLYIDATALGGSLNPWVPSQTDLFANDWLFLDTEGGVAQG